MRRQDLARAILMFDDVPGVLTWGESRADAEVMAADAIAAQLTCAAALRDWPAPSAARAGEVVVALLPLLAAKAALWVAMTEYALDKGSLARRLGVSEAAVRRLLSFRHRTRIGLVEQTLGALGKRLVVEVQEAA